MSGIDRRGLLKGAVASAALIGMPASLQAMTANTQLFIFDGRFAEARNLAAQWQTKGVETLDSQAHDLGHVWRRIISGNVVNFAAGDVQGLTMWMDSFICESFGRDLGMKLNRAPLSASQQLHQWAMR